jgi:hypothetical protein
MGLSRPSFPPFSFFSVAVTWWWCVLPPAILAPADILGVLALGGGRGIGVVFGVCSAVNAVPGVEVRENMLDVGAGVVVAVEGVGAGGGGGGGCAGAMSKAVESFESSHCDGEPRPGEPMSSGGSAERTGAADAEGDDAEADAVAVAGLTMVLWELWARRCGRRIFSRGMIRGGSEEKELSLCLAPVLPPRC